MPSERLSEEQLSELEAVLAKAIEPSPLIHKRAGGLRGGLTREDRDALGDWHGRIAEAKATIINALPALLSELRSLCELAPANLDLDALCERLMKRAAHDRKFSPALPPDFVFLCEEAAATIRSLREQVKAAYKSGKLDGLEEAAGIVKRCRAPCFGKMSAADRKRNQAFIDAETAIRTRIEESRDG